MNPLKSRSVHRYFELADSFVEVQALEGDGLVLGAPKGLNRSAYRRLVIQTCMPEFGSEVERRLQRLFPEDPLLAEDLLYQLCIEVNPQLDIHKVELRTREAGEAKPAPAAAPAGEGGGLPFLTRLRHRSRNLARRLERRVIGQPHAIESVVRAVEKAAVGLSAQGRPLGCFLFVGRTGTGKTELARALGRELFGNAHHSGLVRVDCSEFALSHEYSKLIGAPPGYVGHEDGGQLTEALHKNPETLVLFDEIEKAHPRMHSLLLQVLEEGALTDGKGRRVSFERSFVVLTSNAGAEDVQGASRTVGFDRGRTLDPRSLEDIVHNAVRRQFAPEFVGRLDEMLLFRDLEPTSARRIAQAQLLELALRARRRGTVVSFTPAVALWVAERGFSADHGARELRHVVQRELEPRLARLLVTRNVRRDQLVRARIRGGEPVFDVED